MKAVILAGGLGTRLAEHRVELLETPAEPWHATLVDTGDQTHTGGRLRRIRPHVGDETICMIYGNGNSINEGFFVLEPVMLDGVADDETAWEVEPMQQLAAMGQLVAFRHDGFWQPRDTLRDKNLLRSYGPREPHLERPGK